MKSSSFAPYASVNNELREIFDRLGRAVLVPFAAGATTVPKLPTFEETETAEYLRALSMDNIAVVLGPRSLNLQAICFTETEALEQFAMDNPELVKTAIFSGSQDCVLMFFRVQGFSCKACA